MSNMYIQSINHFRAIAIFFVVFGHSFIISDYSPDTFSSKVFYNLAAGGTTFFVFISGFLFHHLFRNRFDYPDFMIKKTKHVLIPFLILSLIPVLVLYVNYLASGHPERILNYSLIRHFLIGVGGFFMGYWYIPFIMIVFLLSPLFRQLLKLPVHFQVIITVLCLAVSVFLHRGTNAQLYSVIQNVVYFIPVYMLGMIVSEKRETILNGLKRTEIIFLLIAILIATVQVFSGNQGNYRKEPFIYAGIDLMILQKIFFCFFLVIWLNRFETYKERLFELIASNSFGIFFIHGIIIWLIRAVKKQHQFSFEHNSFFIYVMLATAILFASLFVTVSIKKILPRHGKFLVGN